MQARFAFMMALAALLVPTAAEANMPARTPPGQQAHTPYTPPARTAPTPSAPTFTPPSKTSHGVALPTSKKQSTTTPETKTAASKTGASAIGPAGASNTSTAAATTTTGLCTPKATITAADHGPHANKRYYVTVTESPAQPTTVKYQFLFSGSVVSTQYVSGDKGYSFTSKFRDGLLFPSHSIGIPLTVRVLLANKCGTTSVDWNIKPVK